MPDFKVLEKARQMQEAASAKTKEMAQLAPERVAELKGKANAATGSLKERVHDKVTEAMDASFAKVNALTEDVNAALPILEEAGYPVDLLILELGVSPGIAIRFATKIGVKEDRINALLEEHADHKMTVMLLHAIAKARHFQSKVRVGDLKPKGIEIKIGVLPEVELRFG
jgi:gamma-glutamyl:cysteine ligase YbdK (ATP-grasp superfamily)